MKDYDIKLLCAEWWAQKSLERDAVNMRRDIEDRIKAMLGVSDDSLATSKPVTIEELKIVGRLDVKVDSERLQDLANEYGLMEHLKYLFRWKPELNMKEWKEAHGDITGPLSAALTSKPGRASFSINKKEEK